ncbi:MAG: hypothetical protein QNJ42_10470 [Crocosphaera sp.]|nr:hypothetical protein [Crocosphaera sp.]
MPRENPRHQQLLRLNKQREKAQKGKRKKIFSRKNTNEEVTEPKRSMPNQENNSNIIDRYNRREMRQTNRIRNEQQRENLERTEEKMREKIISDHDNMTNRIRNEQQRENLERTEEKKRFDLNAVQMADQLTVVLHHIVKSPEKSEGWKLHVRATKNDAEDIYSKVAGILNEKGVSYKIFKNWKGVLPESTRVQELKFITVYPNTKGEARQLANEMDKVLQTAGYNNNPEDFSLPNEQAIGSSGRVTARYGGYTSDTVKNHQFDNSTNSWKPLNSTIADSRNQVKPEWILDWDDQTNDNEAFPEFQTNQQKAKQDHRRRMLLLNLKNKQETSIEHDSLEGLNKLNQEKNRLRN